MLLDLQKHFQLVEFLLKNTTKFVRFISELGSHSANLNLIDPVLGNVIHDLVHLNKQLRAYCQLVHYLGLHANIVTLVLTKERAGGANSQSTLNADDFDLALVLLTQLLLRSCHTCCLNFTILFSRSYLPL